MEEFRNVLDYSPDSGKLFWKENTLHSSYWNKKYANKEAGCISSDGYVVITYRGKTYKAHRIAWFLLTGKIPDKFIDHINMIKSDNRAVNLREATVAQNAANRVTQKNSTTKCKGVGYRKDINKWYSRIGFRGKTYFLGYVDSMSEAKRRYDEKAKSFYSDYSRS